MTAEQIRAEQTETLDAFSVEADGRSSVVLGRGLDGAGRVVVFAIEWRMARAISEQISRTGDARVSVASWQIISRTEQQQEAQEQEAGQTDEQEAGAEARPQDGRE